MQIDVLVVRTTVRMGQHLQLIAAQPQVESLNKIYIHTHMYNYINYNIMLGKTLYNYNIMLGKTLFDCLQLCLEGTVLYL